MKNQPNRDYNSNDVIMTPPDLARAIVKHFHPYGSILEPCKGTGNFLQFMPGAIWCELSEGKDFFDFQEKVDWIVTNPPWSKVRDFLRKSMQVADNIVFLMTINHLWTKARIRDIREFKFGVAEIAICETPREFPQSGFQLGAIHLVRHYHSYIRFTEILWTQTPPGLLMGQEIELSPAPKRQTRQSRRSGQSGFGRPASQGHPDVCQEPP